MTFVRIIAALALLVLFALPALAGCPVADKKTADRSFREVQQSVEAYEAARESTGGLDMELTKPGEATSLVPGQPPTSAGPPSTQDKAALDKLGFDLDAAQKAKGGGNVSGSPLEIPNPPKQ